jgi:hypothetical protein
VKYEELVMPGMEEGKTCKDMSRVQRGQIWPPECYASIWRAALSGMKSPLLGSNGRPVVVAAILDPGNGNSMKGALLYNSAGGAEADLRVVAFPGDATPGSATEQERLTALVEEEVRQAWYQRRLPIQGFPRVDASPYAGSTPPPPVLEVLEVSLASGQLTLPLGKIGKFLEEDSTRPSAEALAARLRDQYLSSGSQTLVRLNQPSKGPLATPCREPAPARRFGSETPTKEQMLKECMLKCATRDARMQVVVMPDGRGFGIALAAHEVKQGSLFVGCGSVGEGAAMPQAAHAELRQGNVAGATATTGQATGGRRGRKVIASGLKGHHLQERTLQRHWLG